MPTYQYACTTCGERLEAVQSFTDAPLTECPACSGALRKVFSAVGVVFKGSGFYKTDSRSGAKSDTNAKAKAETRSETKAESTTTSDSSSSSTSTPAASTSSSAPASKTA